MARDYQARKLIAERASKYDDPKMTEILTRTFDIMVNTQEPDGCMSNSVVMYAILRSFGYEPEFCYGLCVSPKGYEFYHAWLTLNGEVLDLSIYGNSHFSPLWYDEPLNPVVFETTDNTAVRYGNRVFDQDWPASMISQAVKMSMEQYIDRCPNNGIWKLIFRILNVTPNKNTRDELKRFISKEPFNSHDNTF